MSFLLALAVGGLFALFAWLLWQPAKPEPPTHFLALLTGESDLLSVPPILFEQETLAALKDLDPSGKAFAYAEASLSVDAGDGNAIEAAVSRLNVQPRDRLIVYVSANGVSDDGEAYLLAPDYDLRRPKDGRYPARDLIEALARIDAETKLLIFDCSRLAALPRIGMVANEFVSRVEQAARDVNDPNLWLITAGNELETSPIGLSERRAALGGAIADALRGDADTTANGGNGDHIVSLAELNDFVVQRAASARAATPVPRLTYCGAETSPRALGQRIVFRVQSYRSSAERVGAAKERNKKPAADKKAPDAAAQPKPMRPAGSTGLPQAPGAASARDPQQPPTPNQAPEASPVDKPAASAPTTDAASAKAPAADNPPAGGATEAKSNESPESGPAVTNTKPDPTKPADRPSAATNSPPRPATTGKPEEKSPAIVQAWRLRDQLQRDIPTEGLGLQPVDYAPHLWNELNATLVALHLQQLALPKQDSTATTKSEELIAWYRRGLQALADRSPDVDGVLVTNHLGAAFRRYAESPEHQRLKSLDGAYVQALVDLRRHTARAYQYVQWHGAMLGATGDAGLTREAARTIRQLLVELISLDRKLGQLELEASRFDSWNEAGPLLRQLEASRRRIGDFAAELDRGIATAVASASQDADGAMQRYLETLISTSLATADQREALLAALGRPSAISPPRSQRRPSWSSILEHLRLEFLLVQLADPAMKDSPSLAAATSQGWTSDPDEQQRQLLRAAGKELHDFYARLPSRASQRRQANGTPEESRTLDKLVAIVHPRDASSTTGELDSAIGFVTPLLNPPAEFNLSEPSQVTLIAGQWTPLAWTLQAQNAAAAEVQAKITSFDAGALEVRFAGDAQAARVGDVRTFSNGDPLALEVRAKTAGEGSVESRIKEVGLKVSVRTDAGERDFDSQAQVVIPRPNHVILTAHCVDPRRPQPQQGNECLMLQPFPNRSTQFEFELANASDEAKNLHVELIAVPSPAALNNRLTDNGWPPGRLLDEAGNVAPLLASWAKGGMKNSTIVAVSDVALPPDGKARRLELKPPGAAAPPEPDKKDDAQALAPPPAEPKKADDITYGLVCRVVNQDKPDEVWTTWLEVAPLRPTSYINFRGKVVEREIRIEAAPSDADGDGALDLPPGIAEKPVTLVARGDDTVFQSGSVVPVALGPADRGKLLSIQPLDQVTGRPMVALEVDGFPRAVAWRIDFENQAAVQDNNPTSVRFERVGMADVDPVRSRLYRIAPYVSHPPIDEKQWGVVVDAPQPVCPFDVSHGVRPLEVRLRVDAPLDAFTAIGGGNAIVLSWENDVQSPTRLYDDRAIRSQVTEVTKTGELVIDSNVDDFTLSLPPPGVNDKAVWLTARLAVQGAPNEIHRVLVVFDGSPPQFTATLGQRAIWEGTPDLDVMLDVEDLSGVARIEAWVLEKQPQTEAELDPKAAEIIAIPDTGPFRADAVQSPRLALKVKAPPKEGKYTLVLRVMDGSGQSTSNFATPLSVSVVKPPPPVVVPLIADLKGSVMLGAKPAISGLKITVKENPALSATTDASGQFVIPRVKEGTYTLLVSGRAGSGKVEGKQEITLKEKADYNGKVVIKAALQLAEPPKK